MTILTLVMFALLTHCSVTVCRSQCQSCDQTSCNCSRQNLTEVPAAPALITAFDLSFNKLGAIMKNDFVTHTTLQTLIMNNNVINTIHDQAFILLTNLVHLDLSFNILDSLSAEWFENLRSLQHLDVLGNQYKTLGEGNLFQPLKRLKRLQFGGFYLQAIRKGDFSGLAALEEVIFDGQSLQVYEEGSMAHLGPLKYVTLGLKSPFQRDHSLIKAILRDVVHPSTALTFSDTFFKTDGEMFLFKALSDGGTTSVTLKNVNITVGACVTLLTVLSDSNITMLAVEDSAFFLSFPIHFSSYPSMKKLGELVLKNVEVPQFYNFPALFILQRLLNTLRKLTALNCQLFAIPCKSTMDLSNVEYLDLSNNILSDMTLKQMLCDGNGGLFSVRTLNISRNHLQSISSRLFTSLDKLENLDMSGNVFHSMPDSCYWPPSLKFLNLSATNLRSVTACLPASLRILDVSHNELLLFNIQLPSLTQLYISGNKLISLPEGGLYPRLGFLAIQNNNFHTLSLDKLNGYEDLKVLKAEANTYLCSCEFVAFMTSGLTRHRVTVGDELESYICDSPSAVRGQSVLHARLSVFECHTALAFSLVFFGILAVILLIAGLCHKYSVMWYLKMTWAWLKAKRKPKLKKGALQYDAFVSYSEMDSGWVEAHLVPELEQTEPPLRLCLHKRDFVPGGWILDNIMDAIEKSHRTLFILSQHFVQSEWCKYELNYTQFRLFDQNDDTVVLILLEPIDKETIPKKFCKLRRVMNSRTYLEWPDHDRQIPMFWQSLRTVIKRPENDGESSEDETVI